MPQLCLGKSPFVGSERSQSIAVVEGCGGAGGGADVWQPGGGRRCRLNFPGDFTIRFGVLHNVVR